MKIGILSRGRTLYSTRRIAEAGRKRDHDVRVLDPLKCAYGVDSDALVVHHDGLKLTGFDVIIPRIGASATSHGLNLLRQFELGGLPVVNRSDAIRASRNKFQAAQELAAAGVPVPRTLSTRDASAIPDLVERLDGPPVVIKMNSGTQGVGVIVGDSGEAILSTVQTMWRLGQEICLQEFIEESRGEDLRVFVVDGRVVGAMRRMAKPGDFRSNLHQGASAEKVDLDDACVDVAERAAVELGMTVAGVDILESSRGPLVIEVNSSPGLEGIETVTGRNVARTIIDAAERLVEQGMTS